MKFNYRQFSFSFLFIAAAFSWQLVDPACAETEKKESAKATNPSSINDVVGNWVSEWGPVKFETDKAGVVSGSWEEGKNKIGKISSGKFDASTGSLGYDFCETWTGLKGKATL